MVRSRVVAKDQYQVGVDQVVQLHRPFAGAQHLLQGHPGRFVTQVGAAGQVIGAKLPGKQLQQKRRLIARAAGGVERSLIRRA